MFLKARALRDSGKGNHPYRARALTEYEEKTPWDCGQLGNKSPRAIINTLWFYLTQRFGLRGCQEHYPMQIDDFDEHFDNNGLENFTFSEKRTKTRNAGLRPQQHENIPKMFSTGGNRCIVNLFKLYKSRRPKELQEKGSFYLQPMDNPKTEIWFKAVRMGTNTLGNLIHKMKETSPLNGTDTRMTNHSARKTVVKKVQKRDVQKREITSNHRPPKHERFRFIRRKRRKSTKGFIKYN